MHDREAVGVDGALGLLRHEVVHHAQEARGQEEAHRVVPVPPLDHRVDRPAVDRVGLPCADRNREAVHDVEHGDRRDEGAVEPVRDVDVVGLPLHDRAEEDDGIGDPDDGDQQVDRPLELRVLLRGREAERQRDRRGDDHEPASPRRRSARGPGRRATHGRFAGPRRATSRRARSRRRRRSRRWCGAGAAARSSGTGSPKFSSGQASWAAMITPTNIPTMPQTTVINANCRTTTSS